LESEGGANLVWDYGMWGCVRMLEVFSTNVG